MKQYFLSNHLGNTLAIISDKRFAGTTKNGVITSYVPDIVSATDYSSFGVSLLGRQLNTANVEYGFNGKWNEVESGYQNYGMRDYDARARRFTSVDPLTKKYPELTPYQFASNRPIDGVDQDGEEYISNLKSQLARYYQSAVQAKTSASELKQNQFKAQVLALIRQAPPPPQFRQTPNYTQEQLAQRESIRQENYDREGRNSDGTPKLLTRLSENTTWNNFANNLALPIISFAVGEGVGKVISKAGNIVELPPRLVRVIEEKYSTSPTLGAPTSVDVFVVNPADLKGLTTSEQIAKRLTLVDDHGNLIRGPFKLMEFDTPSEGLAQPFNRKNPGFINGGKTAGGATEYVIPNTYISNLKNVTQKTIK